jgi:hypothetical protein
LKHLPDVIRSRIAVVPLMLRGLILALAATAAVPSFAQDEGAAGVLIVFQATVYDSGDGDLTLDAPEIVTVFTDRPQRIAQPMVTETFLAQAWGTDGPFRQVPPNAVLVSQTTAAVAIVEIFSMTQTDSGIAIQFDLIDGETPTPGDQIAVIIDALGILFPSHQN